MNLIYQNYSFSFEDGGICIERDSSILYRNNNPLFVQLKSISTECIFYYGKYTDIRIIPSTDTNVNSSDGSSNIICASGILNTPTGSSFEFMDSYRVCEYGINLTRQVNVLSVGSDLGFSTAFSFSFTNCSNMNELECFVPGCWYKNNEYGYPDTIGKNTDVEYAWLMETRAALPLFASYNSQNGESICLSRHQSDITLRDLSRYHSENTTDAKCTIGSFGLSNPGNDTLNYTYYGYAVRKENPLPSRGLSIDYIYPCSEGQRPSMNMYGGLDFNNSPMSFTRFYHPVSVGVEHKYSIIITPGAYPDFQSMMKDMWRSTYQRMRADLFKVDHKRFFNDCMNVFDKYTTYYPDDSVGLPFAAQLPNMDINSVSFQFGFVGQQPGIGYLLYRQGILENDKKRIQKGLDIINFWTSKAPLDNGLVSQCYNPAMSGFEPYPIYTRMMADGLEAVLRTYKFALMHKEEHSDWLVFCTKAAEWFIKNQNDDGSFYRGYNTDGSPRLMSKANTPSIIRFMIEMYLLTEDIRLKDAALKAGEWVINTQIPGFEYVGGTCDNVDVLDKEAGIYAMWGCLALYDLTHESKWLAAAQKAADYTETWTYAWSFPVVTRWPKHPFNTYNISGQSIIVIGGAADCYMAACSYTYFRLYLHTGDSHYLDFAEFLQCNTKQSTDVEGKIGYIMPALGNEATDFTLQTVEGYYHWLPWCTFVEAEPTANLFDTFGVYSISEAKNQPLIELQNRNDIYYTSQI